MWSVDWDGGFVVGGDGNRRLTPSFRLKEFRKPDGTVRVHRELVSALQLLRDRFGRSIAVRRTEPDGLGAVVSGEPIALLRDTANRFNAQGLFASVGPHSDGVAVRIPPIEQLSSIDLDQALETAFSVTSASDSPCLVVTLTCWTLTPLISEVDMIWVLASG